VGPVVRMRWAVLGAGGGCVLGLGARGSGMGGAGPVGVGGTGRWPL
jgi:hypothetical protein